MKSILILDDELAIRQSFVDYFEDHNWLTLQAGSAEEALEILKKEQPIAAVVDVRLPGIDGHAFVREICRQGKPLACVFCTGSPDFVVPSELLSEAQVSKQLFKKPHIQMKEIEIELLKISNNLSKTGI